MKIAQITSLAESVPPQSQNGLEFVVSWLAEELIRRGHEVTLFTPSNSKTAGRLVSLLPAGTNNDPATGKLSVLFNYWNAALAASMQDEFDILHFHNAESSCLAPFVRIPMIQTLHHPYEHDSIAVLSATSEAYRKTISSVFPFLEKINYVAVSNSQLNSFKHAEPYFYKKYSMIHNGIPVEKFDFNNTSGDYLLYIGYINKDKGADVAVSVARKLGMKLILAGNNYGQEKFFDEYIKPYLNDKITYIGPVDFKQKNDLYKNALAKLAPLQWHEPFGLTIVEAQACGTPVIALNKGAAKELIIEGITGYVVNTEEEMVEAVKKVGLLDRAACRKNVEEILAS